MFTQNLKAVAACQHLSLLGLLAICVACWGTSAAQAQFGQTTSGGTFGGRTLGGNVTAGNRSLTSAPGNRGGVGQGFGATGIQSGMTQQGGDAGSLSGNERFLRNNRQGQFVGRDMSDTVNFIGQDSGGLSGGLQNLGLLRAVTQNFNQGNSGAAQRGPVPVAYRVAFEHRSPSISVDVLPAVNQRLIKRFPPTATRSVHLVADGQTLILIGTVATEPDRDLAQQLVALEPGVGQIRNELKVNPLSEGEAIPAPRAE